MRSIIIAVSLAAGLAAAAGAKPVRYELPEETAEGSVKNLGQAACLSRADRPG